MNDIHVLVPLDGSTLSEEILPFACAGLDPWQVTLLRIIPPPWAIEVDVAHVVEEEQGAARELVRLAERLAAGFGPRDIRVGVRRGRPAAEILRAVGDLRATHVALATRGRTGFDRLMLGSVAESVIRASPVPVLALRGPDAEMPGDPGKLFERVLIPYDGSPLAWTAVEALARFRSAKRASRITLLSVLDVPVEGVAAPATRALVAEVAAAEGPRLRALADEAAGRARGLGLCAAEADLAKGRPAEKILERAGADRATLVVIATHGRSGPSRWLLGSVAESVLRAATVPLLICPATAGHAARDAARGEAEYETSAF